MSDQEESKEPRKQYRSMFNSSKQEMHCPFKGCGRKFTSDAQLKTHIERRHEADRMAE